MEKYYKRKSTDSSIPTENNDDSNKKYKTEIDLRELPTDPGLRIPISEYKPEIQDQIRRAYIQKGPCQPRAHKFPLKKFGNQSRKFNISRFDDHSNWLEYSIDKDAAFCLSCYLFKPTNGDQSGGDSFVGKGFTNFKKKDRLQKHVGSPLSAHNQARKKCEFLMNQNQHVTTFFSKQSERACSEYRSRLSASVDCVRFLLKQGLAFRGDDESENSSNQGNFLELVQFLADHNDDIKTVTLKNAPENLKLTSSDIQKDIVSATAIETINVIMKDIGNSLFTILVDESRDISVKEQMAVVLRYVDKNGQVIECFVGIEHVANTTALSLNDAIDKLFSRHGLSISRIRDQGYDGASNMKGEFNGLKTLILKESSCAYYVHCFAHQLQLALVVVAKKHIQVASFFSLIANVVNVVGASSKRCDALREKQEAIVIEALESGKISSGRGLNQETSLKRPGDTRWGSHYDTLLRLVGMFAAVIGVLEMIVDDGINSDQRSEANNLLESMLTFDFVFNLVLMKNLLGFTNDLSKALQRKDQDIVNAMKLLKICKERLQGMRDSGCNSFLKQVSTLCTKNGIVVPNMEDTFITKDQLRRTAPKITNLHHFRVEIFYVVIDTQLQELNDRFNEVNTYLLLCLSCFSPRDCFSSFDKKRLIQFAKYYPEDFSTIEHLILDDQLETYIIDMWTSEEFLNLITIGDLAKKMVETRKNNVYPLVYRLMTLALILPVVTTSVERVFSSMSFLKNRLQNRMGDLWMNDSLLVYIEKDIFNNLDNELILRRFQNMKTRRGQL